MGLGFPINGMPQYLTCPPPPDSLLLQRFPFQKRHVREEVHPFCLSHRIPFLTRHHETGQAGSSSILWQAKDKWAGGSKGDADATRIAALRKAGRS